MWIKELVSDCLTLRAKKWTLSPWTPANGNEVSPGPLISFAFCSLLRSGTERVLSALRADFDPTAKQGIEVRKNYGSREACFLGKG
jgi:hypothetical protein